MEGAYDPCLWTGDPSKTITNHHEKTTVRVTTLAVIGASKLYQLLSSHHMVNGKGIYKPVGGISHIKEGKYLLYELREP